MKRMNRSTDTLTSIVMSASKQKRERRRRRYATPLKTEYSYIGVFYCPHNPGCSPLPKDHHQRSKSAFLHLGRRRPRASLHLEKGREAKDRGSELQLLLLSLRLNRRYGIRYPVPFQISCFPVWAEKESRPTFSPVSSWPVVSKSTVHTGKSSFFPL